MTMEPMLKVTDLAVSYGHVEALRGISIEVQKGQIVSIICLLYTSPSPRDA